MKVFLNIKDKPIITIILGNNNFHIKLKSIIFCIPSNRITPTKRPMILPVLSLLVNKPIKHGTIITKVHHPSKKISISVIPIVLSPIITPIITKIIPHKIFFILFISISPIFILFMHSIVCNL